MKTIAILLASGSGSRFGAELPKQYVKVRGKMILEYTLDVFHSCEKIDEIVIVNNSKYRKKIEDLLCEGTYGKVKHVLDGGDSRFISSQIGLQICDDNSKVLFHDAVRPLISEKIILDCISALDRYQVANVVLPCNDTIIEINNNKISNIPDRNRLFKVQTPQGFIASVLKQAYLLSQEDLDYFPTDDCSVIYKYMPHIDIEFVHGDTKNIKITHQDDIAFFESNIKL